MLNKPKMRPTKTMNQRYSAKNGECSSREWTISPPDRSDVRDRFADGQGLRSVFGRVSVWCFACPAYWGKDGMGWGLVRPLARQQRPHLKLYRHPVIFYQ